MKLSKPQIDLLRTIAGGNVYRSAHIARYWGVNVNQTIRAATVRALLRRGLVVIHPEYNHKRRVTITEKGEQLLNP